MMVTPCIIVGLCLAVCGIIILCRTTKKHKEPTSSNPPPLPPRVNVNVPSTSVSQIPKGISTARNIKPLPPRRIASQGSSVGGSARGPRGIRPDQFPCCPLDKQRNVTGGPQLIFWDGSANCYRCSRGHQFRINGKPF